MGSAKLGYSPSPTRFGLPFNKTSDVDVVIISEPLFYKGSRKLFAVLNGLQPGLGAIRQFEEKGKDKDRPSPTVDLRDRRLVKDAIRNFVYENFNPGLLPHDDPLRSEVFENISSTSALFLALEPKVMVSIIRPVAPDHRSS